MTKEQNGVEIFSGNLNDGSFGIELGIYDGMSGKPMRASQENIPSSFNFSRVGSAPLCVLSKDELPNAQIIDYVIWNVDGAVGQNYLNIINPGRYDVCAEIHFNSGEIQTLCSDMIIGYDRSANASIKHFLNQNGYMNAWLDSQVYGIEKAKWFLNGAEMASDVEFGTQLNDSIYDLKAEVSFLNGAVRRKTMIVDGTLSGNFVNDMTFFEEEISVPVARDFNVRIRLTQDGVTYDSEYANNSQSTMTIEDFDYYGVNSEGNPVYKVMATINANLADAQGVTKAVQFSTSFGLEFP